MRLLIAGKYIQINEYFELITENPLINNFDTQYAQYSNSITVPYSGELAKAIDVSLLRKSASPYLLIDGYLIDGVVLLPVKILITNYDPVKNTVTLGVVENNIVAKNLQNVKLTELRHPSSFGDVDECVMPEIEGSVASAFYSGAPLVSPSSEWWNYPTIEANRAIKADLYNIFSRIGSNLDVDIDFSSLGDLSGKFIFANRFKAHPYDLVHPTGCMVASPNFTANQDKKLIFTSAKLASGTYIDGVDGRLKSNFDVLKMKIPAFSIDLIVSNTTEDDRFDVFFNSGQIFLKNSTSIESLSPTTKKIRYHFTRKDTILPAGNIFFDVTIRNMYASNGSILSIEIADNPIYLYLEQDEIPEFEHGSTMQVFQNLPDVTIFDFFKTIAKANAKFVEITSSGVTFKNFADILTPAAIQDVSEYFIQAMNVEYKLYDTPALEYWYKDAETPTLIVPITDARVAGDAKKIEINMLRTDDENVILFEDDGVKPLEGIATYPFFDITDHAADLADFYLAIQSPFVVRAKFRKFDVDPSKSLLVRQLNGLFIPKKIIKTNRDIIELELLKLED